MKHKLHFQAFLEKHRDITGVSSSVGILFLQIGFVGGFVGGRPSEGGYPNNNKPVTKVHAMSMQLMRHLC